MWNLIFQFPVFYETILRIFHLTHITYLLEIVLHILLAVVPVRNGE